MTEECETKVGMSRGTVLSPFIFAAVVDIVTELAREGVLRELLYADELALMSETTKDSGMSSGNGEKLSTVRI